MYSFSNLIIASLIWASICPLVFDNLGILFEGNKISGTCVFDLQCYHAVLPNAMAGPARSPQSTSPPYGFRPSTCLCPALRQSRATSETNVYIHRNSGPSLDSLFALNSCCQRAPSPAHGISSNPIGIALLGSYGRNL